jgi:hypothetical protein
MAPDRDRVVVCVKCGDVDAIDSAVIRSVAELIFLFPDIKITTGLVFEWSGAILSKKIIRRILMENFKAVGYGRWFYFE